MHIESNVALITINGTLVVVLISFLLFLYIINRIMFRPMKDTIQKRDDFISGIKTEIQNAEVELENITDQLAARESEVRNEAFKIKKELENEGSLEANGNHEKADKQIAELISKADAKIKNQIESVKEEIQSESKKLAENIMEKILERRLA